MATIKKAGSALDAVLRARAGKNNPAYRTFIKLLHLTESNKEAAKRLGVSDRTIRRWKSDGITEKSADKYGKKIKRVYVGLRTREENTPIKERKEPRAVFYWQKFVDGPGVKRWYVEGAEYDELLHIILKECALEYAPDVPWFSAFNFVLKFSAPFSGLYDGETFIHEDELSALGAKQRVEARKRGSWIDSSVTEFVTTRHIALHSEICATDPQKYIDALNKYFYSKYTSIYEIKFFEWRRLED